MINAMKIEIPRSVGKMKDQRLKSPDSGRNIIFAADNHTSYLAQLSITRLYLYMAQNLGLTTVSFEDISQPFSLEASAGLSPQTKQMFLEGLNPKKGRHPLKMNGEVILDYDVMIALGANVMGYPLQTIPCRDNSQADDLLEACIRHERYLDSIIEPVSDRNRDTIMRELNARFDKVLEAVGPMIERLDEHFPSLIEEFETASSVKLVKTCARIAQFLRTEDQLAMLQTYMEGNNKEIALMCMGSDHQDAFTTLTKQRGLGSAIFLPNGLSKRDALKEAIWRKEFESNANFQTP